MARSTVRLALAQINPLVGDFEANVSKILSFIERSRDFAADVVVFPELSVTGYPPEDLLFKSRFIQDNLRAVEEVARHVRRDQVVVLGCIELADELYNAATIIHDGKVIATYRKNYLPNYGVFDEKRYFHKGSGGLVFKVGQVRFGVTICEDIWYPGGPARAETIFGDAHVILNLSASPYYLGKTRWREHMVGIRAYDNLAMIAYVNMVGGQDELVFDGGSFVVDENGSVIARAKSFDEDLLIIDVDIGSIVRARLRDIRRREDKLELGFVECTDVRFLDLDGFETTEPKPKVDNRVSPPLDQVEELYLALVLATRDYVHKNKMKEVVVGLSGGIDSSLVACIAVDAVGKENVVGVSMPGPFSSEHSFEDAKKLADNLGIRFLRIPITSVYNEYLKTFAPVFDGLPFDVTEENLQARIRGNTLMALSNKFGWLVLTTGNKSESATGYSTLYGDTAGGFAVIKDVYKTMVYRLARYVNEKNHKEIIPERVFTKPPSAELRENQTDQDRLPPYDLLDAVLELYLENEMDPGEIVRLGFSSDVVAKVVRMVEMNEYKRRQTPPGPKVSKRAFGRDRRVPITNGFRGWLF